MIDIQTNKLNECMKGLNAIFVAIFRCWPLLIVPVVLAIFLGKIAQGREIILATGDNPSAYYVSYISFCAISVLALVFSQFLLDDGEFELQKTDDNTQQDRAKDFARFFVPGFFCTVYFFSVPCWLEINDPTSRSLLVQDDESTKLPLLGLLMVIGSIIPIVRNIGLFPDLFTLLPKQSSRVASKFDELIGSVPKPMRTRSILAIMSYIGWLFAWAFFVEFVFVPPLWIIAGLTVVAMFLCDLFTWERTANIDIKVHRMTRFGLMILSSVCVFFPGLLLVIAPVWFATQIGGVACIVIYAGIGMLVIHGFRRLTRMNVTLGSGLSLTLVVLLLTGSFNTVDIRTLSKTGQNGTWPGIRNVVSRWLDSRKEAIEKANHDPVILVTADGGGIRAGFWSACSLAALEDTTEGRFSNHLFGISAVSGSALGAATYAALIRKYSSNDRIKHEPSPSSRHEEPGLFQTKAATILGHDFLSAPLATMLTQDMIRTITRLNWFLDRGTAIEIAFERAWEREIGSDAFSSPFEELWASDKSFLVPFLFLNGTEASTGKRMIMALPSTAELSESSLDIQEIFGSKSVRLSTAVMMSARFPGISPIGRYVDLKTKDVIHVVDGGYSDNSGAATVIELMNVIQSVAIEKGYGEKIQLVVVMIPNDPQQRVGDESKVDEPKAKPGEEDNFPSDSLIGTAIAPVTTLDKLRQRLATKYKEEIRTKAESNVYELTLFSSDVEFPLGWVLSDRTRQEMQQQILDMKINDKSDFNKIVHLLTPAPKE